MDRKGCASWTLRWQRGRYQRDWKGKTTYRSSTLHLWSQKSLLLSCSMCKVCGSETKNISRILVKMRNLCWRQSSPRYANNVFLLQMKKMRAIVLTATLQWVIFDNTFVEVPLWMRLPTVRIVNRLPSSFYWLLHEVHLQLCRFFS